MTVIDVAGGPTGGAARWRREAEAWVDRRNIADTVLIGRTRYLTAPWLLQRELSHWNTRRIAANNVSYVGGTGRRIVLLGNALHFASAGELRSVPAVPGDLPMQSRIVRAALSRADVVVVPSSDMGDRVIRFVPSVRNRIRVRFHPLSPLPRAERATADYILVPMLPAPHKDLTGALGDLLAAIDLLPERPTVYVTAWPSDLGALAGHPALKALGPQLLEDIDALLLAAAAIYAPTRIESFGYPLAEGRSRGVPVLGLATSRNLEIAGSALIPYRDHDVPSLATAVGEAVATSLMPDPHPFDPDNYFSWITSL